MLEGVMLPACIMPCCNCYAAASRNAELANGRLAMMAIIGMFLEGVNLSAKLLRASVRMVSYGFWSDWKGWFDQMGSCSFVSDSFDAEDQAEVSMLCI